MNCRRRNFSLDPLQSGPNVARPVSANSGNCKCVVANVNGCSPPNESASSSSQYLPDIPRHVSLVKDGDELFRLGGFHEAQTLYEEANDSLNAQIVFEYEAPQHDIALLRRYYNSKTFIAARIELALIADEISKLDTSTR